MLVEIPSKFRFLFNPTRYKVMYGGRGSGKSTSVCIALLLIGVQKQVRILCCREYQTSIKDSVKSLLEEYIDKLGLDWFYRTKVDSIQGINGTEFVFHGLKNNVGKIKSLNNISYAYVEEAENISQNSWDVLIPTIRADDSEIWVVFNTGLDTDATYQMFVKDKRPNSIVEKVNYYDNPFFPEVLREEMEWCKKRDPKKYNHIWLGEPQDLSDVLVFTNWEIGETTEPKDGTYYYGMDFGYAQDPSTVIKCFIDEDKRQLHITDEAYGYKVEIEDLPEMIESVPGAKDNIITADSVRPETISYLRKRGFYMEKSRKGSGSVMEGVEFLQNYDIIVNPKCKNTIYELSHYSFDVDKNTGRIKPKVPVDEHNHLIDALRYALEEYRSRVNYNLIVPGAIN